MGERPKKLLLGILAVIIPVASFVFGAVIVLFTPFNRLVSRIRGHRRENGGDDSDEEDSE